MMTSPIPWNSPPFLPPPLTGRGFLTRRVTPAPLVRPLPSVIYWPKGGTYMIRSQREYKRAMRKMIRRIQSGEEIDSWRESSEDMEILADCILAGYVNGELKDDGKTLRTMDGKIHPIVFNSHIPLKGLAFLHPQIDWKFIIPTIISIIALLCSLLGSLGSPPVQCPQESSSPQQTARPPGNESYTQAPAP